MPEQIEERDFKSILKNMHCLEEKIRRQYITIKH